MFPALALARELMEKGHEAMLVTDERGKHLIGDEVRVEVIPAAGFFGRSLREKLGAAVAYIRGKRRSIEMIERFNPDVVIGAGGYTSFPAIQAAKTKNIPYFLIEQNSVPGRVTRIAAKGAKEIYCERL
jgi:UDP-N-acetylglucosamine--N-acetylmuramyl-(pentapeptide) pyrophosphoryl-undecaprenol N-acetylglucosamine transferase